MPFESTAMTSKEQGWRADKDAPRARPATFDRLIFSEWLWAAFLFGGAALWLVGVVYFRLPDKAQILYSSYVDWVIGPWPRWAAGGTALLLGARYLFLRRIIDETDPCGPLFLFHMNGPLYLLAPALAVMFAAAALAQWVEYHNVRGDVAAPVQICQPVISREREPDCGRRSARTCSRYKYFTTIGDWQSPWQKIKLEGDWSGPVCIRVHPGRFGIPWTYL